MKYFLTVLLSVISFNAFGANEENFTAMTVSSEASMQVKPDVYVLNLNFKFKKDNRADAQKVLNNEVERALEDVKKLNVNYELSNFKVRTENKYETKVSSDIIFTASNKEKLARFDLLKNAKIMKSGKQYQAEIEVYEVAKNKGLSEKLLHRKIRKIKNDAYSNALGVQVHKSITESVRTEMFIASQSIKIETKDAEHLKQISKQFTGFVSSADSYVSEELKQNQKQILFKKAYDKAIKEIEFVKNTMGMKKYDISRVSFTNRNPQPYRNSISFDESVSFSKQANAGVSVNETDEKVILKLNLDVKFYK